MSENFLIFDFFNHFWFLGVLLRLEDQDGTKTQCNGCTTAYIGRATDNSWGGSYLAISVWFRVEFVQYYKIEYFVIGHFNTGRTIHAVLGNSSDINEGSKCLELPTSSSSSTKRTYQCDQEITWIAKFMKFRCQPHTTFNIRELTILGFET